MKTLLSASRQEKIRKSLDISRITSSTCSKNDNPSENCVVKKSNPIEKANDERQASSTSFKDKVEGFKRNMVQNIPLLEKISDYKWAHIKGWYLSWMIVWIAVIFLGFGFASLIGLIGAIIMGVKYYRVRSAEKTLSQGEPDNEAIETPEEPQKPDGTQQSEDSEECGEA